MTKSRKRVGIFAAQTGVRAGKLSKNRKRQTRPPGIAGTDHTETIPDMPDRDMQHSGYAKNLIGSFLVRTHFTDPATNLR
jgi:hypothetical protein